MAVQPLEVRRVLSFLGQVSAVEVEVAVASAAASVEVEVEEEVEVSSVVVEEEVVEVPEGPTIRVASADRVGNSDYRMFAKCRDANNAVITYQGVEEPPL
jgi:hypothetical protein